LAAFGGLASSANGITFERIELSWSVSITACVVESTATPLYDHCEPIAFSVPPAFSTSRTALTIWWTFFVSGL
jgi:hypothetical protein